MLPVLHPPPPPPAALSVNWDLLQFHRGYRTAWDPPRAAPVLPPKLPIAAPPPPWTPRLRVTRSYWFGPAADFFLTLGVAMLASPPAVDRGIGWLLESDPALDPWPGWPGTGSPSASWFPGPPLRATVPPQPDPK